MIRIKTRAGKVRLLCALLLPAGIALYLLAWAMPGFAQWYALHAYPPLASLFSFVTASLPFSLAEWAVYLAALAVLFFAARLVWRLMRAKDRRKSVLLRFAANFAAAAGVLYMVFMLLCGVNYHRPTFADQAALTVKPAGAEELAELCIDLAAQAKQARASGAAAKENFDVFGEHARRAFAQLSETYSFLSGDYGPPKPVLASRAMSHLQISGIYFPFTGEASVNIDIPAHTLGATICHELAHQRGFMREDEASFIAYLACSASGNPNLQYSGAMLALAYTLPALRSEKELFGRVKSELTPEIITDYNADIAYWQSFEGPVSDLASAVNNAYLQANNQSDGVRSYGRVVDLLLAYRRAGLM